MRISYRFVLNTMQFLCGSLHIQCAIPVFDGLLPEPHNRAVLKLLFIMAHWHGLAKLRMHNDLTLDIMDKLTTSLGQELRAFSQKTCPVFETRELQREYGARIRREGKTSESKRRGTVHADVPPQFNQATSNPGINSVHSATGQSISVQTGEISSTSVDTQSRHSGRRCKSFNLNTYKLHSYGDYVDTIRKYGTTDSYSTELVRNTSDFLVSNG